VGVGEAAGKTSLEFQILGPVQVVRAGASVALGGRKQRMALALLLLEAGRVVPTGRLIEDLWLGHPPPSADVTLRSYISRLRPLLRPDASVAARGSGYVLETADGLDLDAQRFERLMREGEEALARGLVRTAADRFRSGLVLWRGRALADVAEGGVLALESGRLEELRVTAIEGRIEAELALGLHEQLVGELERLVGEHPLRERLWRQLMVALYRCNRQADALEAYTRLREELTTELGLEPSEELRHLQQAVLRQEVPLAARVGEQHNLPASLSSFIGRERELAEVLHVLRETRLLTVTGVGGVGKTRLVLAAAAQASSRVERVCFVDLSGVRDPSHVPHAVAEALGIPEIPGRPVLEVLAGYLSTTEPLLVLDNCEHLRETCAELLERLLASAPELHVLATSRERLGVPGEVEYALSPLAVPGDGLDPDELARFASVQLFLERASASGANFAASSEAVVTVARICRDLDGLPLAIELAAVRAQSLSAEEIAAHLDQRFDFLKFWRRVAVPRHQTLRATMDWSYDLLSEQEQQTLRRLSVFAGGFTLASCARVCAAGDESRAVDLLTQLVERSLVVVEPAASGSRYRLLETVRQYSAERLTAAAEAEETYRAHGLAFLRLAEEAFSPGKDGLSMLERDQANLRAALEWSFSRAHEIAPRLARALGRFWQARFQLDEGRAWLERALSLHRPEDALRAELLALLSGLLHDAGDLTEAERILDDGLRIADVVGDPALAARIRVRRADVRLMLGAVSESDALGECAVAAATLESAEDVDGLADALAVIGKLQFWARDPSHQETLERAAALGRESGNRPAELLAFEWLAITFIDLESPTDVAIERQQELLAAAAGEPRFEAGISAPLGWLYGFAGRFAEARDALARSGRIYSADFSWTLEWAGCAMNAGSIELMAGDPAAAERALRPAVDALFAMGETNYLMGTAYYLASSLCEQGRDGDAEQVVESARAAVSPGNDQTEAVFGLVKARLHARRGELDQAERLALDGRACLGGYGSRWLGEALLTHGEVLELAGKLDEATAVFGEALALYEIRRAAPLAERARTALQRVDDRPVPTG